MERSKTANTLNELQVVATKAKMIIPFQMENQTKIQPYEIVALEAILQRVRDLAAELLSELSTNGDAS